MNIQKQLNNQIEALQAEIDAIPLTMTESKRAADLYKKLIGSAMDAGGTFEDISTESQQELMRALDEGKKFAKSIELANLEKTKSMELIQIQTRYLITNKPLVSPSGFHPSELVFPVSSIFIQTNTLPHHVDPTLKIYDMEKVKNRH